MALIVGGVTVTGTQTLDATKLTGNLPALNGSALTNISGGVTSISYNSGQATVGANQNYNVTAPNPGVAFGVVQNSPFMRQARNGGTINLRNMANSGNTLVGFVTIGHSTS